MATKGTYYVGRVLKLGTLDQSMLIDAIRKPVSIKHRNSAWTVIDISEVNQPGHHFIFGRLSKYAPEGEVGLVDEATNSEKKQLEPNLLVASSPFVYIPEHSGIAFLNISGQIETNIFIKRFCDRINKTYDNFFVDCNIDLISDLKSFATKLSALDGIFKIEARISPPNPLFSPLWESLEKYLRSRNTDKMVVIEDAPEKQVLNSDLPELVKEVSKQTEDSASEPNHEIAIGDAAILMAADGYGNGKVRGRKDDEIIVIKTSETAMNFSFDKVPDPYKLYLATLKILDRIKRQRHMEHGD